MMRLKEIGTESMTEILDIIKSHHGYDFSGYAEASLKRRIAGFMERFELKDLYSMKFRMLNDPLFFGFFLQHITVNVTEMFRDPVFYRTLRNEVIPLLAAYPVIKIWHAGCATGEEVYSMCILLKEAGLLQRSALYATDINPANIKQAKTGIVKMQAMKEYTRSYHLSGGKQDFSDYYTAQYNNAIMDKSLLSRVVFSRHNLVSESSFNEFNLVICRNVMIYFKTPLQNHVVNLFYESLAPRGFLALGSKESLLFSDYKNKFEMFQSRDKIYRKK